MSPRSLRNGDSIDGSILAPNATYTKTSANLQGTLIVKNANLAGSEEHFFPFRGYITPPTDPADPTEPGVPTVPTVPTEPAKPAEPGDPTEPAELPASAEPSKPAEPGIPNTPAPAESDTTTNAGVPPSGSLAYTGIEVLAPLSVEVAALLGGAALLVLRRRLRRQ